MTKKQEIDIVCFKVSLQERGLPIESSVEEKRNISGYINFVRTLCSLHSDEEIVRRSLFRKHLTYSQRKRHLPNLPLLPDPTSEEILTQFYRKHPHHAERRNRLDEIANDPFLMVSLMNTVDQILETLTPRQCLTLQQIFGLGPVSQGHTLKEVGNLLGKSVNRIWQLGNKGVLRLHSHKRHQPVIELLDGKKS
ncbi:hypothetical protein HY439_01490 [Candidatus Microgenomates bacterium]|nr:hypothetical protein [Candidatus Microgenomates bacterium]